MRRMTVERALWVRGSEVTVTRRRSPGVSWSIMPRFLCVVVPLGAAGLRGRGVLSLGV